MRAAAALGIALAAAHAAALAIVVPRCRGPALAVTLRAPPAAPALALDGELPAALAARAETALEGSPPGLVRRTWRVRYRGGYERSVGAAQLVGPFQAVTAPPPPAAPVPAAERPCTGRITVSQRLLDDGRAGPGTVAAEMGKAIGAAMAGQSITGLGDFRRVEGVSLRWAELAHHPEDLFAVGVSARGYIRAAARLVFDRIEVPLAVVLVPEPAGTDLRFRIGVRATLDFGNRVFQWVSDKLGGDALATRLARRELDGAVSTVLQPPPPFELPGGQTLSFGYCAEPPEIREGAWGALPFSVALGAARDPAILPPRRGPAPRAPLAAGAALGIDLDLDALNALLFELWRGGFLDRRLAEAGLDRRFNEDPIVTEFLSLRISPPSLALPPVLAPAPHGLRMSADARIAITDGGTATAGRVWGGIDFAFGRRVDEPVSVDLGALELSCERPPGAPAERLATVGQPARVPAITTLVPCYADLVGAMRGRSNEFHGELTRAFADLLAAIFVDRRLETPEFPAALVIRAAAPSVMATAQNASLHLDLDAALVPVLAAPR